MKTLKLIKNDPWLAPYKQAIEAGTIVPWKKFRN